MDKSWIFKVRDTLDYEIGVEEFLIFAEENANDPKRIPFPCKRCANFKKIAVKIIRGHLYENGFSLGYLDWIWNTQGSASRSSVNRNAPTPASTPAPAPTSSRAPIPSPGLASETVNVCDAAYNSSEYNNESYQFRRFVADAEQPLYEGSECIKLESMLKLHNWKARFGISDSAFNDLLSTVGSLLPKDNVMPPNAYEAKKTLSDLGLEYIKYHSCPNNCILYRGVNVDAFECPKCRLSRWKLGNDGKIRINVPAKVMWYFPIIPRFKRMFKSPSTSELMTWHSKQRIEDGKMRHPADSPSWRNINYRWPAFGSDAQNIRLALSADGINPHTNGLTNRYSCWPIVLVTYNLPPWLCMKRKFMMLTILVSGPHEPANDIDVYLQPLIDDLKKLWEEVEPNVYDAYTKSYFTLKAILLWTINDFPAYGNLSGCVNKGYMCCPVCVDDTVAKYLSHRRKMCYQGHRRYLAKNHPYRKQNAAFNGQQELGQARQPLSGEEVLLQQDKIKFQFGKEVRKSKKVDCPWKKKWVFFELEYWKFHHVRHCLDVMHVEKNVCDSLIDTLLNMKSKSKDSEASHLDMIDMGVRADLAPQKGEKKPYLPPSIFNLSKTEKKKMLSSLMHMKLPYGQSSNIKKCVSMEELKMFGMKSHDCHILLQQLLPIAIRAVLPKKVRVTVIRLCFFFNALCSKVVDVSKLDKLQSDVIVTLCELEKIFLASFFDIMIHLIVHLVRELRLCGPVFYRWMYAFERFNKVLKSYVRNRYYPEGYIAECYLGEESVEFCQEFVKQACTTAGLRKDEGKLSGPLSIVTMKSIDEKERDEAHLHVLLNNIEVQPYIFCHWILVVIWAGEVFILNPLPRSTTYPELEKAISRAVIAFNIQAGRGNKAPTIRYVTGCPKQPGGTECGYVVMWYMKEIAMDNEMTFVKKWSKKNRKVTVAKAELDEVRFLECDILPEKEETKEAQPGVEIDLDPRMPESSEKAGVAEDTVSVMVDDFDPTKELKIGKQLSAELHIALTSFLKKNLDVFAWSHSDMIGVDPKVMCHHLNIDPDKRAIR
ncbi:uncharacterized protein LOC141698318 [Apium graveolens]|uniref:uncharacterized protein LOC141698318 n=1 Tax=Apium graveolens TaxID=4045 RepID=UPI003D7BF74B